jgi:hypothetical protein
MMANNASGVIKFAAGGTGEDMRIDSTGKVGIGTTNPGYVLDVSGTARFTGTVTLPSANTAVSCTGCLTKTNLDTTTGTASGNVGNNSNVNVTMNDYSFFANIYSTSCYVVPSTSNNADTIARAGVYNDSGSTVAYSFRWRYVTSSRPPELFVWYDLQNNVIVDMWRSEIDHPEVLPIKEDKVPVDANGNPLWIPVQITVTNKAILADDKIQDHYTLDRFEKRTNLSQNDELIKNAAPTTKFITNPDIYYGKLKKCDTCAKYWAAQTAKSQAEQNHLANLPKNQQKADLAEWYATQASNQPQPGDLVSVGPNGLIAK